MKSNTPQQLTGFLKIYDGFIKAGDESEFIKYLTESTVQQGMKEFKELKKCANQTINLLFWADKIAPEGNIAGLFAVVN